MNDYIPDSNFVVIDFETANINEHACSLGVVEVINGKIQDPHYWLIKPLCYPNFNPANTRINKITAEMVADAPTFEQLWISELRDLLHGKIIVAHNAKFDVRLLAQSLIDIGITPPHIKYMCTMEFAQRCYPFIDSYKLTALCEQFDIPLEDHHNAACDAVATAKLALKLIETHKVSKATLEKKHFFDTLKVSIYSPIFESKPYTSTPSEAQLELQSKIAKYICSDDMCCPEFIQGKEFCITGQFANYERDELAEKIESLGGVRRSGITKKIDIVFVGEGAGSSKIQKISEQNESGKNIIVFNEEHIEKIINN